MTIATRRRDCPLCGARGGRVLFEAGDLNAATTPLRFSVVRCACGMAFLDPVPADPAQVYPATYDAHAEAAPRRRKSTRFAAVAKLKPGRLLDLGCGSGRDLLSMREKGWSVRGVEINPEAAARARAAGLDVRTGTVLDAGLEDASADLATLFHVLEHVADPGAVAREVRRVLAPGGLLLAHVPNFAGLNARLFREHWYELDVPRHVNFFTRRSLERMTREAGLEIRTLRTRAAGGDFRRSMALKFGRNPLRPVDSGIRAVGKLASLAGFGDVLEIVAARPA